jgi:hypothetical protein
MRWSASLLYPYLLIGIVLIYMSRPSRDQEPTRGPHSFHHRHCDRNSGCFRAERLLVRGFRGRAIPIGYPDLHVFLAENSKRAIRFQNRTPLWQTIVQSGWTIGVDGRFWMDSGHFADATGQRLCAHTRPSVDHRLCSEADLRVKCGDIYPDFRRWSIASIRERIQKLARPS